MRLLFPNGEHAPVELKQGVLRGTEKLRAAEQGTYGICERCGNPIAPERLQIFPETRLCIDCKNEVEREQRRLRM